MCLVATPVFKTGGGARVPRRVRFPSASATPLQMCLQAKHICLIPFVPGSKDQPTCLGLGVLGHGVKAPLLTLESCDVSLRVTPSPGGGVVVSSHCDAVFGLTGAAVQPVSVWWVSGVVVAV